MLYCNLGFILLATTPISNTIVLNKFNPVTKQEVAAFYSVHISINNHCSIPARGKLYSPLHN